MNARTLSKYKYKNLGETLRYKKEDIKIRDTEILKKGI